MKPLKLWLILLLPLSSLPSLADNATGQAISPSMLRDQQHLEQLEDQRLEREANSQAMTVQQNRLIHQCRQLLKQQSKYPGEIHILSIQLAEDQGAYFKGRFSEPDASGQPQTLHYRCHISADKASIESLTIKPLRH